MILTEFIESLGYENPVELANWITGILKDKEKSVFKKMLIERDPILRRSGKTKVSTDARTLIDNLCILKQFMKLFPKNWDEDNPQIFPPYRILKDLKERMNQLNDPEKLKSRIMRDITIQKQTLSNLDAFRELIQSETEIDITRKSLRKLLENFTDENINLKNSYVISKRTEISDLEEKLEKNPDDTSTAKTLAAKYTAIGKNEEAIELLEPLIKEKPDDLVANVVLSFAYFKLLAEKCVEFEKFRHLEGEPFLDSPINSVEQYQKEQYENAWQEYDIFRRFFIDSCFKTLRLWKVDQKMEFYEFDEEIQELGLTIGWFLHHFIAAQNPSDFCYGKDDIIALLKGLYLKKMPSTTDFGLKFYTMNHYSNDNTVRLKLFLIFNYSDSLTRKEKSAFNRLFTGTIKKYPKGWLDYFLYSGHSSELKMFLGEKTFRSMISFLKRFEIANIKERCENALAPVEKNGDD